MSTATPTSSDTEVVYPDSDGMPIGENTLQFDWIMTLKGGLEVAFRDRPDVFVAGDLLWYPVQGDPTTRVAPDTMVVIGRPKGYRGSYIQHREDGIGPQVVFEILSPGNRPDAMNRKLKFYERFGVEEYYLYDPEDFQLDGWQRDGEALRPIPRMDGWVSPRLGLRFDLSGGELVLYGPDGKRFLELLERAEQHEEAIQQRNEAARQRDEAARQRDEAARQRDENARQRDDALRERAEQRFRLERLEAQLRALGGDPGD